MIDHYEHLMSAPRRQYEDVALYQCERCFAVVEGQGRTRHDEWHEGLAHTAQLALRGADEVRVK